jgi:hypothetical protein
MRREFKLSSDGGYPGSKKCKRGYGGVYRSLHLVWTWSKAVGCLLVRLAGICLQLPYKIFNKLCIFNAIYKDNIAINCITKAKAVPLHAMKALGGEEV